MYYMRPNSNQEFVYRYLKAKQDVFAAADSIDQLMKTTSDQDALDKYLKANADIIKAQTSVSQLTLQQKRLLSLEVSAEALSLSLWGLGGIK